MPFVSLLISLIFQDRHRVLYGGSSVRVVIVTELIVLTYPETFIFVFPHGLTVRINTPPTLVFLRVIRVCILHWIKCQGWLRLTVRNPGQNGYLEATKSYLPHLKMINTFLPYLWNLISSYPGSTTHRDYEKNTHKEIFMHLRFKILRKASEKRYLKLHTRYSPFLTVYSRSFSMCMFACLKRKRHLFTL